MPPAVSFIIPAYNEQALLPRCVRSIHNAATENNLAYEIVVADDASDDQTAEIAVSLGCEVVSKHNRQIAATRNSGAAASKGDLLVFVDADSEVSSTLVAQTLQAFEAGAIGGGSRCAFDGRLPLWARVVGRVFMPLYALAGLTPGAYIFATRQAFEAAGGFDERVFGGEEVLLAKALKRQGRFTIVRAAVVTSGRKLRTYSGREILWMMLRLVRGGTKGVRTRDGMELWYGPRREDPGCPETPRPSIRR